MTSRRTTRVGAALLAISLVAAACGGGDDGDDGGGGDDGDAAPVSTIADLEENEIETGDIITDEPAETADGGGDADGDGGSGDPAPTGPTAGGTVRYAIEAEVDGLNPATSSLSAPGLMMSSAVFDTLAAFDVDGNAVPYLAESFTPNEDFTSWQVKLRPGITFHDGTPLNADALLVNFETQLQDPIVGLAVRPFYPDPATGGVPIEKVDDLTVQLNLLEPNANIGDALTSQLGFVASPTWLAAALEDPALNQQPVGTGPFVFDRREEDSVTRFVRNENYWNGEVYLDAIEFLPRTDPDVRADLLIEGEIEALHTSDPSAVQKLTAVDSLQNLLDETGEESFLMINSANPPFDDIRAREALARATPRQNYQQLIALGQNRLADQRYIPESKFYNPDVRQVGDDPDGAKPLVDAYCADVPENCSNGAIDMEYQWAGPSVVGTRTADLLEQGWNGLFNMERQELPQDDHILEAVTGQYNVVAWRQFGAVDPAGDNVWLLCRTAAGLALNFARLCDEQRDALLLEGSAITDEERRIEIYREVEQRINQDYVYVFLVHTTWNNAFAPNVRGVCDRTSPEGVALRCSVNGRTFHNALWLAE